MNEYLWSEKRSIRVFKKFVKAVDRDATKETDHSVAHRL